jgi:glycosyltransferase involved in cell wall biosynthesis
MDMNSPKEYKKNLVSIYTPTYNTKSLIKKVYESVKNQQYTDWEWVICDDGSKEETRQILQALQAQDSRIQLFFFDNCGNIGKMKKRCTERCRGEFLVELDHDDQLTDDCLTEVVKAFRDNEEAGMVYSNCTEVTDEGECHTYNAPYWQYRENEYKGKTYLEGLQPDFYGQEASLPMQNARYWELMPNHVRAFRAEVLFELGGYDDTLIYADDYDIIARMYLHSKIVHIPKMLYLYRWGENTWTSDKNADLQEKMAYVRDKYFPEKRLHLGCGSYKAVGFEGIDEHPYAGVDHIVDFANDGLIKFAENSIDHIHSIDYIQKIADKHHTLKHIYRVLKHNGIAYLQVPSTDGRGAFQDPDHKSYWNENSFLPQYMEHQGAYHFSVENVSTTKHNALGICWTKVRLRALKES